MTRLQIEYDGELVAHVDGDRKVLSGNEFELLLQLAHARHTSITGYVWPRNDDPEAVRKLVYLLRRRIGRDLVQTGKKSYRLVFEADEMEFDESLTELPTGMACPRLIEALLQLSDDAALQL